jgi:hypothetical protein
MHRKYADAQDQPRHGVRTGTGRRQKEGEMAGELQAKIIIVTGASQGIRREEVRDAFRTL